MTIIRPIKKSDNADVAEMIRAVFDEYNATKEGTVYTDPTTDQLFELFNKKEAIFFIAEINGNIVGSCGIYPTSGLPIGHGELVKFYVAESVRGTGIGRQLYEQSEAFALTSGYQSLYIESMPDFSDAVKLYEKIGYQRLDTPLGQSGHFGCDIWMLKVLRENP